jgi:hypothetical protein
LWQLHLLISANINENIPGRWGKGVIIINGLQKSQQMGVVCMQVSVSMCGLVFLAFLDDR